MYTTENDFYTLIWPWVQSSEEQEGKNFIKSSVRVCHESVIQWCPQLLRFEFSLLKKKKLKGKLFVEGFRCRKWGTDEGIDFNHWYIINQLRLRVLRDCEPERKIRKIHTQSSVQFRFNGPSENNPCDFQRTIYKKMFHGFNSWKVESSCLRDTSVNKRMYFTSPLFSHRERSRNGSDRITFTDLKYCFCS